MVFLCACLVDEACSKAGRDPQFLPESKVGWMDHVRFEKEFEDRLPQSVSKSPMWHYEVEPSQDEPLLSWGYLHLNLDFSSPGENLKKNLFS